jgi:hypothetical protein
MEVGMELQEIELVIGKDGKVQIMVRGVKGAACLELTRELEALLGGEIEARQMTPEALEGAGLKLPAEQKHKAG